QRIDEVHSVDSLSEELLFPPMLSFSIPDVQSELYWLYVGDYHVETFCVPSFFISQLLDYENISLYDSSLWVLVHNLGQGKPTVSTFSEARKHGIWLHVDLPTVRTRITMQWMKKHKVDYEQYYIDSMSEIQVKLMFDLTTYVNN
ncbi:MAG: hypothetical protein AAFP77_31740, partial [Bacteroidota bacterium]